MKRGLLTVLAFLLLSSAAFCGPEGQPYGEGLYGEGDGWLLTAMPFELSGNRSPALRKAASDIPSLMLEKIAGDASHVLSLSEKLDRQLFRLQTQRLSLCLQLSRELKVRDGLVLGEEDARKLKRKIAGEEGKLAALEESIRKNLAEAERLKGQYDAADAGPSVLEEIRILDRNAFSLLELPAGEDEAGYALRTGLSGLIRGSIESFGNFVSVTAELLCYPGGRSAGSVTELGELSELSELADNLVVALLPKIANTMPVRLEFAVSPEEARASCQIFIDGILLKEGAEEATVSYGEHRLEICADGFFTRSLSYRFTESSRYSVAVPMERLADGSFGLTFAEGLGGASFPGAGGLASVRERSLPVTINGKAVIGRFFALPGEGLPPPDASWPAGGPGGYYYYVAPGLQEDGGSLSVRLKPRPTDEEIDRRRIWSYRGYSALMLALPAAFLAYGNYLEVRDGYSRGGELPGSLDNAADLSNTVTTVAALAGGFFLFELFRYVHTVSGLLPQEAAAAEGD